MKCDRCGKEMKNEVAEIGTTYDICRDCSSELDEFMKGTELCKCNQAYFTVMCEDVWA